MSINELAHKIMKETTTSADISYLPGGFTTMKKHMQTLSRMKPRWKIKVLEERDNYRLAFEDSVNIIVPKTCWDEFVDKVLKTKSVVKGDLTVDLGSYLTEAKSDDVKKAYVKFIGNLMTSLIQEPIASVDRHINQWVLNFGIAKYITGKEVMLKFESLEYDIDTFKLRVDREFEGAVGHLNLLAESLKEKKPLTGFDVLEEYDYFIGSVARSMYEGIELVFDVRIDMTWGVSEKITVLNNEDLLSEISGLKGIKIVGNDIYPIGSGFDIVFLNRLKKEILEIIEK